MGLGLIAETQSRDLADGCCQVCIPTCILSACQCDKGTDKCLIRMIPFTFVSQSVDMHRKLKFLSFDMHSKSYES